MKDEEKKRVREMECLLCGHTPCDAHHVVRRSKLGTDTYDNLIPLCRKCHMDFHYGDNTTVSLVSQAAVEHFKYMDRLEQSRE